MVSVQCYMFVCRLVNSVQGVITIDLSSFGCIVPWDIKSIKKVHVHLRDQFLVLKFFDLKYY